MKKSILLITIICGMMSASCKKEFKCDCATSSGSHDDFKIMGNDKDDAGAQCTAKEIGGPYVNCQIE